MNILLYEWNAYMQKDIIKALQHMNINYEYMYYILSNTDYDSFFYEKFKTKLQNSSFDCVFSINFWSGIAQICHECSIPYISWGYDAIFYDELTPSMNYNTNYIYVFDSVIQKEMQQKGYSRIYYHPLAVDAERIQQLIAGLDSTTQYDCDLSFVGSLYNRGNQLDRFFESTEESLRSVKDNLIALYYSDMNRNLLYSDISDTFTEHLNQQLSADAKKQLSRYELINLFGSNITSHYRKKMICSIAQNSNIDLYSSDQLECIAPQFEDHISYKGTVFYYSEMPCVFHCSKLNYIYMLKSIPSGIPLRCLDVLASGGVLLTNSNIELENTFSDGQNIIFYHSEQELLEKINFYTKNDSLRQSIAHNGLALVQKQFGYTDALLDLFRAAHILH